MIDKAKVKKHFSRSAHKYDANAQLHCRIVSDLLDWLPQEAPLKVVDLGCGTGLLTAGIKKKYPRSKVIGVDLAPQMLTVAQKKVPGAQFVEADAEALPFADGEFDMVVSASSFQWMDAQKVANETARILRPKGKLIFSTFGEGTLKELETLGFRIHKLPDLSEWQKYLSKKYASVQLEQKIFREFFRSPKELTDFLKIIGARGAFEGEGSRPINRLKFLALRQNTGFIATFNTIYGQAIK